MFSVCITREKRKTGHRPFNAFSKGSDLLRHQLHLLNKAPNYNKHAHFGAFKNGNQNSSILLVQFSGR
ncbi:hypothetical protein MUG91_G403n3 [Manis pentadactyla]|nr:hypothetical protein MUG91_G403n3 [Manis pentadactyla]